MTEIIPFNPGLGVLLNGPNLLKCIFLRDTPIFEFPLEGSRSHTPNSNVVPAFSPCGKYLVYADGSDVVIMKDLDNEHLRLFFDADVTGLAINFTSTYLAIGFSRYIKIFHMGKGEIVTTCDISHSITSLIFHPFCSFHAVIAAGGESLTVCNISQSTVHTVELDGHITCIDASYQKENVIAFGDVNGTVTIMRIDSMEKKKFQSHIGSVVGVSFSPVNRRLLISAGEDGNIFMYDLNRMIKLNAAIVVGAMKSCKFSSDGHVLGFILDEGVFETRDLKNSSVPRDRFVVDDELAGIQWQFPPAEDTQYTSVIEGTRIYTRKANEARKREGIKNEIDAATQRELPVIDTHGGEKATENEEKDVEYGEPEVVGERTPMVQQTKRKIFDHDEDESKVAEELLHPTEYASFNTQQMVLDAISGLHSDFIRRFAALDSKLDSFASSVNSRLSSIEEKLKTNALL
ncbi:hypothetical protein PCE1_004445 [Barthelona sp. PCE]